MIKPDAGKDAKELDHSYIVGGNVKWYDHSENSLMFSYKSKYVITICSKNYTLGKMKWKSVHEYS